MTPLVLLLLLVFLMVIAASLMIWAALTLGDARRRGAPAPSDRAAATGTGPALPAATRGGGAASSGFQRRPVWRADERSGADRGQRAPGGPSEPAPAVAARPSKPSNDEVRGARAIVTPRSTQDDAFERFLDGETKDRRASSDRTGARRRD